MARIRAVIDTNVVFEGLTYRAGPAGTIVDAWVAELFQSCVSQALAYEYAGETSSRHASSFTCRSCRPSTS